jgi:cytochrome c biogenesis protein CcmG/thiol:disulfide interchange protein DsbE
MIHRLLACAALAAAVSNAADFRLKDDRGKTVSIAKYKGKVVLLNFWATWCHGCVQEIPWLMEYQQKYKRQGLVVLGVSMDEDGWAKVRPYIHEKKVNYPVVIGSDSLARQFELDNMPMTLLYGRDGKVAAKHVGMVDREGCEREIAALLDAK